ncbi:MAG: 2Fe-2S iron-sulfur cluster-binding protein, partial [Acidimicrobiales bacterium]|nr:2Fe-2S iron-sulfur cluster-binding protein [Acidimicrobiales bacterium]
MTTFDLNGTTVEASVDHPHLLAALRDELGVTSPKDGCSPSGQCGCCTVLVDGKARVSCQTSMDKADGASITTLEGLDEDERQRYAMTFAAHGALQCGFCIPGIVMRTKALLDKASSKGKVLERGDAARHLGAHLCRCTGYVKVLDAVESLAAGEVPVPLPRGGVGSSGIKVEAFELSLGDRPYVDDLFPEGLLHAALRLADHARADIVRIDTSAAEAVDGVHRVLTAADIPGARRVGIIHIDWPVMIPEGGRTSYLGDVLAVVVADDRETARRAAELVTVEQVPLTVYSDPVVAVAADEDAVWELDGNVLSVSTYARGDVEAALAGSAHVVEEVFQTQRIEHA